VTAPYRSGPSGPPAAENQPAPVKRIRIPRLHAMKERGEKWAMLTAYDTYAA
jgi:3-methyl-2-oxobutanoate hydroxymethyltransferase